MADSGRTRRDGPGAGVVVPLTGRRCPICGRPTSAGYRPFCSLRCADRDLAHWLGGEYRIPTGEHADADDEAVED